MQGLRMRAQLRMGWWTCACMKMVLGGTVLQLTWGATGAAAEGSVAVRLHA
jgi:hypothetical protein